jgi:hypothetical protein
MADMKKENIVLILTLGILSACHHKNRESVAPIDSTVDTARRDGLPLDNIRRSRESDTFTSDKVKDFGVPLDNLDRNKADD